MNLIIESGSTKADWMIYTSPDDAITFRSHGINPTTLPDLNVISLEEDLIKHLSLVDTIFYYGAGINSQKAADRIENWLQNKCPNAKHIEVAEDCLAAARACFGNEEGIVAILGTGSNSSYYDGNDVTNLLPTLGYIISDEGGGTYFGKEILRAYFYNLMPEQVRRYMEANYLIDKTDILSQLYQGRESNRFLASYADLLTKVDHEWCNRLVEKCMTLFLNLRILPFIGDGNTPVSFVGSIAYYHENTLRKLCHEHGVNIQEIIHKPLDRLLEYHLTLL